MTLKIYVGNLSFKCTNENLAELFGGNNKDPGFGTVLSASVITDRDTGRSKGFGFVEMENADEAKNAINALHGKEYMGRNLTVNEARPREKSNRDFGGDDRGDNRNRNSNNNYNRR